jgi:type IV pilus assembly protein PilV
MSVTSMNTPTQYRRHGASHMGGFTLIEVLVSLVVLSIGLLGMAKLMLLSSHSNDSAYLRSQATALAYEILDNMRANRVEATSQPTYNTLKTALATTAAPPGTICIGAAGCSSTQLATFDVYEWKLRLNTASGLPGALPNGKGSVATATVGSQTTVTINVFWDDTVGQSTFGAATSTDTQSVVLETVL